MQLHAARASSLCRNQFDKIAAVQTTGSLKVFAQLAEQLLAFGMFVCSWDISLFAKSGMMILLNQIGSLLGIHGTSWN